MPTATATAPAPSVASALADQRQVDTAYAAERRQKAMPFYARLLANADAPLPEDLRDLTDILDAAGRTPEQFADDAAAYKAAKVKTEIYLAHADADAITRETADLRQKRDALKRQAEQQLNDLDRAIHVSQQRHTQRSNAESDLWRLARERPHLFTGTPDCPRLIEPAPVTPPEVAAPAKRTKM